MRCKNYGVASLLNDNGIIYSDSKTKADTMQVLVGFQSQNP